MNPSRFESGEALIDYQGGIGTFPEISFWRVLRGTAPAGLFRGKIVVLGATAPSLQDLHATPTSGNGLMPGPEVQANAIWTALHGNPLRDAPGWLTAIAVLLAALVAPLAAWRLNVVKSALIVAATAAATSLSPRWRSTRAWWSLSRPRFSRLPSAARPCSQPATSRRALTAGYSVGRCVVAPNSCETPRSKSSPGSCRPPSRAMATPAITSTASATFASGWHSRSDRPRQGAHAPPRQRNARRRQDRHT